jgi:hypothetical protein
VDATVRAFQPPSEFSWLSTRTGGAAHGPCCERAVALTDATQTSPCDVPLVPCGHAGLISYYNSCRHTVGSSATGEPPLPLATGCFSGRASVWADPPDMAAATRQTSRSPSPSRTERSAREDATAEWTRRLSRPELSRAASPRPAPRDGGEVSACRAAPGRVQWRFGPIRCRARRGLAQLYPLCSPGAVLRGYVTTSAESQGACDRRVLRRTDWVAAAASGRAAELPDRPRHQSPARPRCRTRCLRTPVLRNVEQKEPRNRSARVSWWRQQWAAVRVCARVWVPACGCERCS